MGIKSLWMNMDNFVSVTVKSDKTRLAHIHSEIIKLGSEQGKISIMILIQIEF